MVHSCINQDHYVTRFSSSRVKANNMRKVTNKFKELLTLLNVSCLCTSLENETLGDIYF